MILPQEIEKIIRHLFHLCFCICFSHFVSDAHSVYGSDLISMASKQVSISMENRHTTTHAHAYTYIYFRCFGVKIKLSVSKSMYASPPIFSKNKCFLILVWQCSEEGNTHKISSFGAHYCLCLYLQVSLVQLFDGNFLLFFNPQINYLK